MATNNLPYYSLENALNNLFLDFQDFSEVNFKMFDSHSKVSYGIPHAFGKCVQISVENINNLLI